MLHRIIKHFLRKGIVLFFVSSLSISLFGGQNTLTLSNEDLSQNQDSVQAAADANLNLDSLKLYDSYTDEVKQHFSRFLNGENPLGYSEQNSRVYFVVTNVENDKDFTYLKMYIVNNSTSKYAIDEIILMQVEDPMGGRKASGILKTEYITPVDKRLPMDGSVNANGRELLGFVIPLYNGIDNGKLIIQVFENNGSRNGKIEIKAKDITRAKLYGQ